MDIYCKARANTKMLMDSIIKDWIIIGARKANGTIIDIIKVESSPRLKIHQVLLEYYIPFLKKCDELSLQEIHEALERCLNNIKDGIKMEYEVSIKTLEWIKWIEHYVEE
jgi:rRNA maturation protein Rpf1